jgi:O-antigen ligase
VDHESLSKTIEVSSGVEAVAEEQRPPRRERRSRKPERSYKSPSNRASWGVLVLLMVFAPLAFGAVEYWSIAVVEFLMLLVALLWIGGAARRGNLAVELNSLILAPLALQLWVGFQLLRGHTLDRRLTWESLLLLFCYFLLFLAVSNEQWSARWVRRLALVVAAIGSGVALFGLVQFFTWNGRLYWIRPITLSSPFGPYVNRNHFAGLMEMTVLVALGLALSKRSGPLVKGVLLFAAIVMALATLMSLSRGGLISLMVGLVAFAFLYSRRRAARPVLLVVGLLLAVAIAWLAWLGARPLVERLSALSKLSREATVEDRIWIAKDTLQLIQDHPFLGTGLGTYPLAVPSYVSHYFPREWDKAHNDYLQLLAEVGLVGFSLAVWWLVAFGRSLAAALRSKSTSPVRLGAYCGCLALLVHSFGDFNLQIPANAILFTVLAALATRRSPDAAPVERGEGEALPASLESPPVAAS